MNHTRLQIAKPDIVRHFDQLDQRVFRRSDLTSILDEQRAFWRLAQSTTAQRFIHFLSESAKLTTIRFPFPNRPETCYAWGNASYLEALLTIKPGSYLCHYSAVKIHGLTEQIPKTIYANIEQPAKRHRDKQLVQSRIDAAFRAKVRVSNNVAETADFRICLLNGMQTQNLGVIDQDIIDDQGNPAKVRVTNLERTMIDIAVRPVYSGAVFEVLKAYQAARERASVNRLTAILQKLDYIYPYHQVIGFYLDRAGYMPAAVDLLRRFPIHFDFYLTHAMGQTDYIKEWRLHVPQGF